MFTTEQKLAFLSRLISEAPDENYDILYEIRGDYSTIESCEAELKKARAAMAKFVEETDRNTEELGRCILRLLRETGAYATLLEDVRRIARTEAESEALRNLQEPV